MSLSVTEERPPLVTDADGVIRVGDTRVTLDTVVAAFCEGKMPEGIAEQYPALGLAEVYGVVAYYLRHRAAVDAYLLERENLAAQVRRDNETLHSPCGVRERLLARRPSEG